MQVLLGKSISGQLPFVPLNGVVPEMHRVKPLTSTFVPSAADTPENILELSLLNSVSTTLAKSDKPP